MYFRDVARQVLRQAPAGSVVEEGGILFDTNEETLVHRLSARGRAIIQLRHNL